MEGLAEKTVVIILAGGKGSRLGQLTGHRAKPAVPFAGKFRMIDFVLSNCLHSGLNRIIVPTQYKSLSLTDHLDEWRRNFILEKGESLRAVQPQARTTSDLEPYTGTADAVYENLYSVLRFKPEIDLILAGDHIYKMDYRDLILFHQQKQAELTIAALETDDRDLAKRSGVLSIDESGKVIDFEEKPREPKSIPGKPGRFLISMGIYVFNHKMMVEELTNDAANLKSQHDFGKNIIPKMIKESRNVFAFQFQGYWLDIGTIDAYYAAQMDLVSVVPQFNLYDETWPWLTFGKQRPPTKIVFDERIKNSVISEGCFFDRGEIRGSVISPGVKIGMDAQIIDSVLLEEVVVGAGSRIVKTIIDKNNRIPKGSVIEMGNIKFDGENKTNIEVTPSGIVVIPRYFEPYEEIES
ncbi:MAG: sugar phosphate nucleotidyltransferase [bacterium]|nr:sugar phosphate nucleotidyltransferase [bacterium]